MEQLNFVSPTSQIPLPHTTSWVTTGVAVGGTGVLVGGTGVFVWVGVSVGVAVGVSVGVEVEVAVGVGVSVEVAVAVAVAVTGHSAELSKVSVWRLGKGAPVSLMLLFTPWASHAA
jgi:hypothetical protein